MMEEISRSKIHPVESAAPTPKPVIVNNQKVVKVKNPIKVPPEKLEPLKLTNIQTKSTLIAPQVSLKPPAFETGWDRVKAMFQKDECNMRSPEMMYVSHGATVGGFTGLILGAYLGGKEAHFDFIRKNEVTLFYGQNDGRRRLNDHIMLGAIRRAFYYGWRLSFFTASFLTTMLTVSTYRNKSSLLDYIAAGGVTGAIFKSDLGLKGMVSGGVIGASMATIPGALILSLMWITGITQEDMRYLMNERKAKYQSELQKRHSKFRENTADSGESYDDLLTLAHDERIKSEKLKT